MTVSINPNTLEEYKLPEILDDRRRIEQFIQKNKEKKVIVVQGLGFVGAVMSLVCANSIIEEYAVIGVDLPNSDNFWKIQSLNQGVFPLIADDPKIEEFFELSRKKENFLATFDPLAYQYADVIIVEVNLDAKTAIKH